MHTTHRNIGRSSPRPSKPPHQLSQLSLSWLSCIVVLETTAVLHRCVCFAAMGKTTAPAVYACAECKRRRLGSEVAAKTAPAESQPEPDHEDEHDSWPPRTGRRIKVFTLGGMWVCPPGVGEGDQYGSIPQDSWSVKMLLKTQPWVEILRPPN